MSLTAVLRACVAASLVALPDAACATEAAQEVEGATTHEATLKRCSVLARNDPHAAVGLAEAVLADDSAVETEIRAWVCLGQARAALGDPAAASSAVSQVLQHLDRQPVVEGEAAYALGQAGGILQTIGQNARAATLYERSRELTRREGSPRAEMIALLNIAGLHGGALGDPEAAEPYFRQALEIGARIGAETSYMNFNHGFNLVRLERHDEALRVLDRATALADAGEQQEGVKYRAESLRAEIHLARGELARARSALESALEGQRGLPDAQGETITLRRLAHLQMRENRLDAALATAQQALALAEQGGFREEQHAALREMAAILQALGRHADAVAAAERRHGMELAALSEQNLRSLAGMQADLENQANARKLESLEHEAKLQAMNVARARLLRNLAIALLGLVAAVGVAFALYQRRINRKLFVLSTTDPLTGLVNRRLGARRLTGLAARPLDRNVLMLVDVDRFKEVNDIHGHPAGDAVLVELAERLRASCRNDDLIARWGGEEFLIACRQQDFEQAQALAERLCRRVSDHPVVLAGGVSIALTVSIGFAPLPFFPRGPQSDWHQVVSLADRALYAVKRSGRDAWAGLWNIHEEGTTLDAIERDPVRAADSGLVRLASSRSVEWNAG